VGVLQAKVPFSAVIVELRKKRAVPKSIFVGEWRMEKE